MSVVMSEYEAIWRNVRTPRVSLTAVEYAQPLTREELEQAAKWPDRLMLVGIGIVLGLFIAAPAFWG